MLGPRFSALHSAKNLKPLRQSFARDGYVARRAERIGHARDGRRELKLNRGIDQREGVLRVKQRPMFGGRSIIL